MVSVIRAPGGHHAVATGALELLLTGLAIAVVVLVFALCVTYFLRPGEGSARHIKRRVLE